MGRGCWCWLQAETRWPTVISVSRARCPAQLGSGRAVHPQALSAHLLGSCAWDEFLCDAGRCLPLASVCDSFHDCTDHRDEANCSHKPPGAGGPGRAGGTWARDR